ncbi:hypothetical protein P389DRAFT_32369 [Cystobasidium minutum MCA 4210]|uniref:uncharacterized protein n=1 Tax=Cystobasidium minutum MCA 4210 TaxID=1397322 RepID=UPI0034CEEBB2|eukprot:jgi/Rhomi1/32369/CE32368_266
MSDESSSPPAYNAKAVEYEDKTTRSAAQDRLLRSLRPFVKRLPASDSNTLQENLFGSLLAHADFEVIPQYPDFDDLNQLLEAALECCLSQAPADPFENRCEVYSLAARLTKLLEIEGQDSEELHSDSRPNLIDCLPLEVLVKILALSLQLAMQDEGSPQAGKEAANKKAFGAAKTSMSPAQAQEWMLSLSLVSKKWQDAVAQVVWSNIYIIDTKMLYNIIEAIKAKPDRADLIANSARVILEQHAIAAKSKRRSQAHHVNDTWGGNATTTGGWGAGNNNNGWGDGTNNAGGWGGGGWGDGGNNAGSWGWASGADAAEEGINEILPWAVANPVDMFLQFLQLTKKLRRLTIHTAKFMDSGLSQRDERVTFMRTAVLETLSAAALVSLDIDCMILFLHLEDLLLNTSSLQSLRITGGIDNADGRDIMPAREHNNKFRHFLVLANRLYGRLERQQLCWLLRPAIGHLVSLELMLPHTSQTWAGARQPFASTLFADLLVLLAPTLSRLKINVMEYLAEHWDWESIEPHHGNLSFALSHCERLQNISMPWVLAGPGVINALEHCTQLETMDMNGLPLEASSYELCAAIEEGPFQNLKEIRLRHFALSPPPDGWSVRDLKALCDLCQARDINLVYP